MRRAFRSACNNVRGTIWQIVPLLTLAGCLAFAGASFAQPAPRRPNVLLIITDDQGYGDLGLHGNEQVSTPALDRLGRESIRFDRFFVSPLCAPTRASLLTGRYSLRTGVSGVSEGQETMRAEELTIAEALRALGYRTGLFGKWHNGEHYPYTPNGQGFQESFGFNLGHWNNYFDTTLKHNGRSVKTKGFITDVLTDAALKFISAKHDQPFFCYLSYNAPHSPFQVPDKYFDKYKAKGLSDYLASVYGMVENVDDNVARALGRLDELKLRDDTIVIFMTDNGPNGERFNGGMRGAKGSLHEGGSRVPFFLSWPARFKQPRLVKQIAAHIDVFPTLLELCGAPMPKTLPQDGRSLVPLLEGKGESWPDRTLFTQHRLNPNTGAVRTERYRMVNEGRGWELFDMESDPAQKKNIAAEQPEVAKRLTTAYEAWWREVLPQTRQARAPIPVGYTEENPIELPVPQSQFTGGLRYSGRHPNNAWLTNWTNVEATVEWEIDVVRAGKYEVGLQYLCPKNAAGSRVRISVAGGATEATLRETSGQQIKSPDRAPRTEVYEMDWATLRAGAIMLPQGRTTLTVRALTKPGEVVMDLKSVTLKMSLLGAVPNAEAGGQNSTRPNIVLILADDLGYETLGCYGGTSYRTPNLDRLAAGGMRFEHAYATPLCTPTRAQLMTGRYAYRDWLGFGLLDPKARTFGHYLKDAGYRTLMAGKWQFTSYDPVDYPGAEKRRGIGMRAADAGFDEYSLWHTGHTEDKGSRYADPVIFENGKFREDTRGKYGDDLWTDYVNGFIERNRRQPFFVYYAMALTHDPFVPTPDSPEWTDSARRSKAEPRYFKDMVEYADKLIGKIVAKLDELGLRENTLILFYGDNGTHQRITSRMGERTVRGGKGLMTDAGTRVPLIANWKGTTPAGRVSADLIDSTDFLPTLLEAARRKPPVGAATDGRSFLSQLRGEKGRPREWLYMHHDPRPGWDKDRFRLERFARTQRFKLYDDGRLFDIPADDLEEKPIRPGAETKASAAARARLQKVLDSHKPFPIFTPDKTP